MADTTEFELVSPARLLKSEQVEMVVVPGGDGDIGVLPGHSLLISTVRPGVIDIHEGGPRAHRLRHVLLADAAADVDEVDPRLRRHVDVGGC